MISPDIGFIVTEKCIKYAQAELNGTAGADLEPDFLNGEPDQSLRWIMNLLNLVGKDNTQPETDRLTAFMYDYHFYENSLSFEDKEATALHLGICRRLCQTGLELFKSRGLVYRNMEDLDYLAELLTNEQLFQKKLEREQRSA